MIRFIDIEQQGGSSHRLFSWGIFAAHKDGGILKYRESPAPSVHLNSTDPKP